jgi:hypothetical protein
MAIQGVRSRPEMLAAQDKQEPAEETWIAADRLGVRGAQSRLLSALVCGLATAGVWVSPALAESRLSWSTPVRVDPQPPPSHGSVLHGISCVSEALCVAVDDAGNVVISTAPASRTGAWSVEPVLAPTEIGGVSCASTSLCVAVGGAYVVTSPNPTGGPAAWTATIVDPGGRGINGVSCPSISLCVAIDSAGKVLTSTNPTGGASAWTITGVDLSPEGYMGANDIYAVSCASPSLCIAVDDAGNVLTSTNPTGGAGAWKVTNVDGFSYTYSVSCASGSLCIAGNWTGDLLSSTNPTGGTSAWTVTPVDPEVHGDLTPSAISGVSCPSTSLCVAVDQHGNVLTSTNPSGGAGAWTLTNVDSNGIKGISCPSTSLCVAVDDAGNAVIGDVLSPPAAAPTLTDVSQTNNTWREGNLRATFARRHRPPIGTTFSFSLNEPASVAFKFTERPTGRMVGSTCVAQSKTRSKKRRCTRVAAGSLKFSAHIGRNEVRFQGLTSKHNRLKPGSYTLLITATALGKHSTTSTLHFTIAAG